MDQPNQPNWAFGLVHLPDNCPHGPPPWLVRAARGSLDRLGGALLSGMASRFGLSGKGISYGSFEAFEQYTAEVNAFMPRPSIPFLAWVAAAAELGSSLTPGRRRPVALRGLLLIFRAGHGHCRWEPSPRSITRCSPASAAALLLATGDETGHP